MKVVGDTAYFESTGREEGAVFGIIGLCVALPDGGVFQGYDSGFVYDEPLTAEERNELADFMIEKWNQYRTSDG